LTRINIQERDARSRIDSNRSRFRGTAFYRRPRDRER